MSKDMREMITDGVVELSERPVVEAVYKGRLTVVEQVYHQQYGSSPTVADSRYTKVLDSEEQPYVRKTKIGPEWVPLDIGWIKEVGTVRISNEEGRFSLVNPTEQERQESSNKVLEISFGGKTADILIFPLESARFQPMHNRDIQVRCLEGSCQVVINVYPR